jgi:polar amino acid transport system substrate-binding protein
MCDAIPSAPRTRATPLRDSDGNRDGDRGPAGRGAAEAGPRSRGRRGACAVSRTRLAALALVLAGWACGCGRAPEDALARVRRTGVLRYGADVQGGEPFASEDPAQPGRYIGFEVELMDAVAARLGVRARLVQSDWSSLLPSLERGGFDVAVNGLEVTPERAAAVRFSRPYLVFSERLVVRRGDEGRLRDLDSLRGRRVGTLASSLGWTTLLRAGADAVPYEGVEEPYRDLVHGRLDAVLLDDVIADRYGLVKPELVHAADVGEGHYAMAVRRGDGRLGAALDDALGDVIASGELRRILARWGLDGPRVDALERWSDADAARRVTASSARAFGWGHVWLFVRGAGVTLGISGAAMAIAIALGLLLALVRAHGPAPAAAAAGLYVELFRGTPVLLQLYVLYFGLPSLSPTLELGPLTAAVLGLGLNYAAYEAEVYRAGLLAVPPGQFEAARVLGMSTSLALRRVVLPQALRVALPGVTNDFIALLKDSSLVSVITVVELTKRMTITAVDVRSWALPGLLCAGLYLAMSYPLSRLARRLERLLSGDDEEARP